MILMISLVFCLSDSLANLDSKFDEKALNANVVSMSLDGKTIYLGLDNGEIQTLDLQNLELSEIFRLNPIKDFMGDEIANKPTSISVFDGIVGFLYDLEVSKKAFGVLNGSEFKSYNLDGISPQYAYLLDENTAIFVSLSSEIVHFDLKNGVVKFKDKLTTSGITTASFSWDLLGLGCEGGVVFIYDAKEQILIKTLNSHKDSVLSLRLNQDKIMSGSTDKSVSFTDNFGTRKFQSDFLVYGVGLGDDLLAYTTQNSLKVFKFSGELVGEFAQKGAYMEFLEFYDDMLIGAGYDNKVYIWRVR